MPRPKIDPYWRYQTHGLLANNPKLSATAIERRLEQEALRMGRADWPSARTINRLRAEFDAMSQEERRKHYRFSWPEAMESGAVPWEASRAALDLLAFCREEIPGFSPAIRLAVWFWRVTLAAPSLDVSRRFGLALDLESLESGVPFYQFLSGLVHTEEEHKILIQNYLAFAPWSSPKAAAAYRRFLEELGWLESYDPEQLTTEIVEVYSPQRARLQGDLSSAPAGKQRQRKGD